MKALSVPAANASSSTCWFGPAWLAQSIGVIAGHASTTGCSEAQVVLTKAATLEETWEATGCATHAHNTC